LAATLRRAAGAPDRARVLLEEAAAVAPADQPLAVSIAAERAQIASVEGRHHDAIEAWSDALARGREADLGAPGTAALFRGRAASLASLGRLSEAAADFSDAFLLVESDSGTATACFVLIEEAGLLLQFGHRAEAEEVVRDVEARAPSDDSHLRAEILVLRARLAREDGDWPGSVDSATRARTAALEAVAPVSYFAACVELAAAYGYRGDFEAAYTVLATAWGTLSDVIGPEAASAWVEPVLAAYRVTWGAERFARAKAAHDERRRRT
jgi:tetratricopeptide (TPR) repeat protein